MLFYPWGDLWKSQGSGGYNFANLPSHELGGFAQQGRSPFIEPDIARGPAPLRHSISLPVLFFAVSPS